MAQQWREGLAGGVLGGLVGVLCWAGWPASFPLPMTIVYSGGFGLLLGLSYGARVADWLGDLLVSLW
jgi:hypothetical protein